MIIITFKNKHGRPHYGIMGMAVLLRQTVLSIAQAARFLNRLDSIRVDRLIDTLIWRHSTLKMGLEFWTPCMLVHAHFLLPHRYIKCNLKGSELVTGPTQNSSHMPTLIQPTDQWHAKSVLIKVRRQIKSALEETVRSGIFHMPRIPCKDLESMAFFISILQSN